MSGLQVALSLYEREVGLKPEKVHHAKKMWFFSDGKKINYTHSFCNFGALSMLTEVLFISLLLHKLTAPLNIAHLVEKETHDFKMASTSKKNFRIAHVLSCDHLGP